MKILIIISIVISKSFLIVSQGIINSKVDTVDIDTIIKTEYYSNKILCEKIFVKNILISEICYLKLSDVLSKKLYYENGNIKSDIEPGSERNYYDNGQLKSEFFTGKDLNKRYIVLEYYDRYGRSLNYGYFSNGDGTLFTYDDFGSIDKLLEYKNGLLIDTFLNENSKFTIYYKTGLLWKTFEFQNKMEYANEIKSYFYEDILINQYSINGKLRYSLHYDDHFVPKGIHKEFYKNGKLKIETNWVYNQEFEIDSKGILLQYQCYEKNYYSNGIIKSEGNIKNALYTGNWIYYNKKGVIKKQIKYSEL